MSSTVVYYHIYLTDDYGTWSSIVMEQFKAMEDSGLLDAIDDLEVTCVGKNDSRVPIFNNLIRSFYPTAEIEFVESPFDSDESMIYNINNNTYTDKDSHTENHTLKKIYQHSQGHDMKFLYLHAKGITAVTNHLKRNNIGMFKNYYYWRQYLNWGTIENWKACHDKLNTYDTAGINFFTKPAPHYSSNVWWSKSDHIKTLPDPTTKDWWIKMQNETTDSWLKTAPDRFRFEQWLCSRSGTTAFNILDIPQEDNPAFKLMKSSYYRR